MSWNEREGRWTRTPRHARADEPTDARAAAALETTPSAAQDAATAGVVTGNVATDDAAKDGGAVAGNAAATGASVSPGVPAPRGRHPWSVVYVVLILYALVVPAVALPFAPSDPMAEMQELAEAPALINTDGHPNVGVLADAGEWFDDHFAFRQPLITANARVMADGLGTSPTESVIVGREGYLYYGGTLADYARTSMISAAEADNAAFNLAMMERAVRAGGADFLLAVAPNKNSLYPQFMPYYDLAGTGESSWERLRAALDAHGVTYVDLFTLFEDADDVRYMKTDSHWTTDGARMAYNAIMERLGQAHLDFEDSAVSWDTSFVGDLEKLLYPLGRVPEPLAVIEEAEQFSYIGEGDDVEDAEIVTASEASEASEAAERGGSLVMYRDSFGNALLPFFATQYERAYFTKLVPYYLQPVAERAADTVIVERAERHLDFFATTPPLMAAPRVRGLSISGTAETDSTMEWAENGPFLEVSGIVSPDWRGEGDRIFIVVTDAAGGETWYEAFHQTVEEADDEDAEDGATTLDEVDRAAYERAHPPRRDCGYYASIPLEALPADATATLVVAHEGATTALLDVQLDRP